MSTVEPSRWTIIDKLTSSTDLNSILNREIHYLYVFQRFFECLFYHHFRVHFAEPGWSVPRNGNHITVLCLQTCGDTLTIRMHV